jgi:hypothetical protein
MSEQYTELFVIQYNGQLTDILNAIESTSGVQKARCSQPTHRTVDEPIDVEITYDTHETDRTRLAQQIETYNGVQEVTFG